MTRTTKTAAAAPAPGNGPDRKPETRKPAPLPAGKAGPVRITKTEPASLADLSADDLAELLANALVTKAKPARTAAPRVTLTAEAAQAFEAMGWSAPRVDATHQWQPQPRTRHNASKGAAAYTVTVAALQAGPVRLSDVARLWLASGNDPKAVSAIAQQLANRAGVPIAQAGDLLQLAA